MTAARNGIAAPGVRPTRHHVTQNERDENRGEQ